MVGVMGIPTGRSMLRHAYTLISIPMGSFAMARWGSYDYIKVPPRKQTHSITIKRLTIYKNPLPSSVSGMGTFGSGSAFSFEDYLGVERSFTRLGCE